MNTEGAEVLMCRIVRQYSDMLLHLAFSRLQTVQISALTFSSASFRNGKQCSRKEWKIRL